jgi:hypothetical protein
LHSWGSSKLIERHGATGDALPSGADQPWSAGRADVRPPLPTRAPFGQIGPVVYAASTQAFNFGHFANPESALGVVLQKFDGQLHSAQTWQARVDIIERHKPNLLVLLPHADVIPRRDEVLQIGSADALLKGSIDIPYVREPRAVQSLPLLGCGTADVTTQFAPYPELFREVSVDVVIAPIAPILGGDAIPIASRLPELLRDAQDGQEIAFGELLRPLRQQLLAAGHPGVLGLVAFGDADWIFGHAQP